MIAGLFETTSKHRDAIDWLLALAVGLPLLAAISGWFGELMVKQNMREGVTSERELVRVGKARRWILITSLFASGVCLLLAVALGAA